MMPLLLTELNLLDLLKKSILIYCPIVLCLVNAGEIACAQSQSQSQSRFIHWSYQDGIALGKEITPLVPLLGIASGTYLLAGLHNDEPIRSTIQRGYGGGWKSYLDVTNELGGSTMLYPVAGLFGISLLIDNNRFQDAAFTSLESLFYAGLFTYSLKQTFGRVRPEDGGTPNQFRPFSGHSAFPSGHATAAFAIVTPWVLYYPHPVTYGLFALSSGTAIARIANNKHWPTDVLAGAAIGFFTARSLVRKHKMQTGDDNIRISSSVAPYGFYVKLTW